MAERTLDWISSEKMIKAAKKMRTKKFWSTFIPIIGWLPKYNFTCLAGDIIAGLTVGLTVIPQGIAYATVANLPPQYGLYSAFIGCFVYMVFGSCKDISVGPTAIMALMTAEYATLGPEFAVLLAFLSGLVIFGLGSIRMGVVIDFVSVPVIAGFTSAAAITIATGQVSSVLGLKMTNKSHVEGIVGSWMDIVNNISSTRVGDTVLGVICIIVLLYMRAMKNFSCCQTPEDPQMATTVQSLWKWIPEQRKRIIRKVIWLISTARNAIVVVICGLMAFGFDPVIQNPDSRNTTFLLVGNIKGGLPAPQIPPFSANTTSGKHLGFTEMVSELGSAVVIIPFIAILENIAIAKAFAGGTQVDANQEMLALGLCNLAGSFFQSITVTGSFSRTAVNSASGVKTPAGGLFTGILVMLALGVLMPYCAYIPKASLAAVIITAVVFSIEIGVVHPMWRSKRSDLVPAIATFLTCLFWALEYGILVGVALQITFILHQAARPEIIIEIQKVHPETDSEFLWISPDRALIFPSTNYVRNVINKAAIKQGRSTMAVVLDCTHVSSTDFTTAKGLRSLISDFKSRNQHIIFYNTQLSVLDTFVGASRKDLITVVHSLEELRTYLHDLICGHDEHGSCNDQRNCLANGDVVEVVVTAPESPGTKQDDGDILVKSSETAESDKL